jgi:hypothetical protein
MLLRRSQICYQLWRSPIGSTVAECRVYFLSMKSTFSAPQASLATVRISANQGHTHHSSQQISNPLRLGHLLCRGDRTPSYSTESCVENCDRPSFYSTPGVCINRRGVRLSRTIVFNPSFRILNQCWIGRAAHAGCVLIYPVHCTPCRGFLAFLFWQHMAADALPLL